MKKQKQKEQGPVFNKDLNSISKYSGLSNLKNMTTIEMLKFAFDEAIWGSDFEITEEQAVKIKSLLITNYFELELKRNADISEDFAEQKIKFQGVK